MKKIILAALFFVLASTAVFAQSTQSSAPASVTVSQPNGGTVAMGYVYSPLGNFASNSLAVRIALYDYFSLEGSFGFIAGDNDDGCVAGVKAIYVLKEYLDFNLYASGGINIGYSNPEHDDSTTAIGAYVGAGVEYFLANNLSVSSEFGVNANFQDGNNKFGTFGDWLSNLGLRYYFD